MVAAIIPIYNPNKDFNKFLIDVKKNIEHIIVIDDGSDDYVITDIKNVKVLRNRVNRGKGYSLRKAFKYAIKNNFDCAITIDGDGQHDPQKVKQFLLYNNKIDIVIGNRAFNDPMPFHRRISNNITSLMLSLRTGNRILDSQCGYRKYNLKALEKYVFYENGFHFESEVLMKILLGGGSLGHISVPTIYNNSKSYINNFSDTFKFISLLVKSLFW